MAVATSLATVDYVLEDDRELKAEDQTIFKIKPLSAREHADLQNKIKISGMGKDATVENLGEHLLFVLEKGLIGWANFNDAEGKMVKFVKTALMENITRIPVDYRSEIMEAINDLSGMTKADSKN